MNSHFVYVGAAKSASGELWQRDCVFGASLLNCGQSGNEMGFCTQPRSHCPNTCTVHKTNQSAIKFHRGNNFK